MTAIDLVSAVAKRLALALSSVHRELLSRNLPTVPEPLEHYIQYLAHLPPLFWARTEISQLGMLKSGELFSRVALPLQILAVAVILLTAPLIADLTLSALGNLRRSRMARRGDEQDVRLAVVVPAHNHEPVIAQTLQSLETAGCAFYVSSADDNSNSKAWEIQAFVVAHNCSDSTAAVAAGCGARVVALNDETDQSKGAALRLGFEAARSAGANAFLVVDADSLAGPNLIAATRASLVSGAVATQCRVQVVIPSTGTAALNERLRAMAFRAKSIVRPRGRAGIGFSSCVVGNGFAITMEALNQAPFEVYEIYDNLEYHARLVSAGMRVRWVDHAFVYAPLASIQSAGVRAGAELPGRLRVASRVTGQLLMALLRGRWRAAAVLAEAWSLPVIALIAALLAIAFVPLLSARIFAVALAVIVLLYALETLLLGPEPWRDLAAPFSSAARSIRSLPNSLSTLRQSRKSARWTRSGREAHHP
jgi:hypothetical protein